MSGHCRRALQVLLGGALVLGGGVYFSKTTSLFSPAGSPVPQAEFGGVSLRLRYATSSAARARGLAGVRHLDAEEGMLFVFPTERLEGFWMKDMLIPIDIFWLDAQGQVVSMQVDVQPGSYPDVFYPVVPARWVLETSAGFAQRAGVATGTTLRLQKFPDVSE